MSTRKTKTATNASDFLDFLDKEHNKPYTPKPIVIIESPAFIKKFGHLMPSKPMLGSVK